MTDETRPTADEADGRPGQRSDGDDEPPVETDRVRDPTVGATTGGEDGTAAVATPPIDADREPGENPEAAVSVRLDGLSVTFPGGSEDVLAVDDVSLSVSDGEFLVLVGPSGCGKTTLLRAVAGLESPTDGRVLIEGADVTGLDPRERDVAMVFQNYALYPHKTVRGNVAFPLKVRKYPAEERERRVRETAELLDITDLLDRKPGQLSGGQQQRVALGRAIVREPAVFLLDEPLSNLDAKLRTRMRTKLNELHRRVGETTIYVTHDQAEAMTLGDRVAVVNDGRLQQVGPPQHVYDRPATRFVAGFIGEPAMNFFDAELRESPDGYRVRTDCFELPLADGHAEAIDRWDGDPGSVTFGVRPEDVHDAALRDADDERTVRATVRLVEPLGSERLVTLTEPGGGLDADVEFTASFDPRSDAAVGETVAVTVDAARAHLFDATGENLLHDDDGS